MVKGAYSLTCAFFTRSIYSIFLSTQVLDIELLCSRSLSEKKTNAVDPGNPYNGVNNPAAQCIHATENTGHKITIISRIASLSIGVLIPTTPLTIESGASVSSEPAALIGSCT